MMFPLAGNGGIKNNIETSLAFGRFPHAVIIEGESGSGKNVLAKFIAAALLCENDNSPCGECRSCKQVMAGTHPDLFYRAPEDNKKSISVEQIRTLRNEAYIRPQMSDKKVFILDCADTMNSQSQNAILKILEEPPGKTFFLLLARSRAALLPTIISRCVTFALCDPDIEESSEYICKNYGISYDDAKELLHQNSNNIGRAVAALNSKKSGMYQLAADYLDAAENGTVYDLLVYTLPLEKERVKAAEFFSNLSFLLLSRIKEGATNGKNTKKLFRLYEACREAQVALQSNVNLPLLFSITATKFKS